MPPMALLVGGPLLLVLLAVVLTLTLEKGGSHSSQKKVAADWPDSRPANATAATAWDTEIGQAGAVPQPRGAGGNSAWASAGDYERQAYAREASPGFATPTAGQPQQAAFQGAAAAPPFHGAAPPDWNGYSAAQSVNYPASAPGTGMPPIACYSGSSRDDALRVAGIPSWGPPAANASTDIIRTSYSATADAPVANVAETEILRKFVLRNRAAQDVMAQLMKLVDIDARMVQFQFSTGQEEMDQMRREAQRTAWQDPAAARQAIPFVMAVINPYDNSILTCGSSEKTALISQAIAAIDVVSE